MLLKKYLEYHFCLLQMDVTPISASLANDKNKYVFIIMA